MPWRWAGWTAAALLLVAAAVLLVRSVPVSGGATCGSSWDVATGRADWATWWAQDGADPVSASRPVRTQDCPGAVDARLAWVGASAGLAVLASAAGEVLQRRRAPAAVPVAPPARRLHRVGTVLLASGLLVTGAGAAGVLVVTADPGAAVFDYVGRPLAVVAGLLLLLPAVLLAGLGAVARAAARALGEHDA